MCVQVSTLQTYPILHDGSSAILREGPLVMQHLLSQARKLVQITKSEGHHDPMNACISTACKTPTQSDGPEPLP